MHMIFRTYIDNTSARQVFDMIANIDDYETWLPNSKSFFGIRHISDNPIKVGTIYTDGQGILTMHGKVIAYKEPSEIAFNQVANSRAFGFIPVGMDLTITYILVPEHNGTTVIRNYNVQFKGLLKILRPFAISRIKEENNRILHVMKQILEKTY